jgi:hypothetical protein
MRIIFSQTLEKLEKAWKKLEQKLENKKKGEI